MDGDLQPAVVRTTCPYCGTGCGVNVRRKGDEVEVSGDAKHPTNRGKLCVKGSALGDTVGASGRLLHPQFRNRAEGHSLNRVSWSSALDRVAQGFVETIRDHGPDSVAFYVSGQLLTEDYYVANKLMKGFIGSSNIDTNSRLCMSSAVAGHKRAFGEDIVPVAYEDLERADLIVLVGSNTAWCHPILFQRIVQEKERRPELKLVVIDPRRTATTEMADLHLPIRPGADVWLFNGLLSFLHAHGVNDAEFVERHTQGFARAMSIADNTAGDVRSVAAKCRLQEAAVSEFFRLFARTEKTITAFSMGVNQSSSGTDKVNSIINCHLLTGRIGKPGAGPFSITGQPNAMGGREVGGLSNMLAAHMDLGNDLHQSLVQGFWQSPVIADKPGLKAVELFEAVEAGQVKALWIMATNPVVSLPNADQVRCALKACPLVVVSDCMEKTDTAQFADVLLPARGWGEKDGTVTNSERCISRLRSFLPPLGEAKPDWWALAEVGKRMGHEEAFSWDAVHEVFDEHCRLTAHENSDEAAPRYLDLGGLAGLSAADYASLEPQRWPVPAGAAASLDVFADGRFFTPSLRANFVETAPKLPKHEIDEDYPLVLNSGRIRDHWHTMTRTGLSARLSSHIAEPYVDIHAQDALLSGVKEGDLARLRSRWGSCVVRVRISGQMARKQVFVPIHWNGRFASDARVGALVNPVVDPVSGEPEFKHTPVAVEPFMVSWHGFAFSRGELPMTESVWWTRIAGESFNRFEFAGRGSVTSWSERAHAMLSVDADDPDWLEYEDTSAGLYRAAWIVGDQIEACLFVSPRQDLPSRAWLSSLFNKTALAAEDRMGLLVGEAFGQEADTGETVCSCFGIGRKTIEAAIKQGCDSPKKLGEKLRCGTNCGSCVPELKSIVAQCLAPV